MSEQSLDGLLGRLQGKSITSGWDAVVTMNRAKVNQLLEQQYITQFNQNSFLKRIHGSVKLDADGHLMLDLTGLLLSKPLLSFENASLTGSRARLHMNLVSGMVAYREGGGSSPTRITSSFALTEQHGFSLVMDIDLQAIAGAVDKHGEVILDLAKAHDFSCDMVEGSMAQSRLGDFFGALFQRLPASSRVYRLGMLDFDPDDKLAPRNFEVRTQAAPGGRDKNSDSYQEGAVVLFVRTRSNDFNGTTPNDDFPYLIPDDRDAGGKPLFSGSLILASRIVFDKFLHEILEGNVGEGLKLQPISDSNLTARGYRAYAGGCLLDNIDVYEPGTGENYRMRNNVPLNYKFASGESGSVALTITVAEGGLLKFAWKSVNTFSFRFNRQVARIDYEEDANVRFTHELGFFLRPEVDPVTSVVTFVAASELTRTCSSQKLGGDIEYRAFLRQQCEASLLARLDSLHQQLNRIEMVELDLFAINHLLFPEQNALLLTHSYLPGDLALFGHIDPRHTSFAVEPTFVNVEAGTTQRFEIRDTRFQGKAVTWSVRGIDGSRSVGEIAPNGQFTAPPRDRMEGQAVRNVVTATTTDAETGQELTSSALVVVVGQAVVVLPSMATIDLEDSKPVEFKASTLTGASLQWKLLSGPGTLQPNVDRAIYTPPAKIDEGIGSALVEVTDSSSGSKVVATVLLLKSRFYLHVTPAFHPGVPPGGALRLRMTSNGADPEAVRWSVVAGQGTVDEITGEFTAPATITMPYSVVQAQISDFFDDTWGYGIVYQSEYASEARWHDLSVFDLKPDSSLNLFYNGQQQVSVRVEVKPMDVDGFPVEVSEAELNSIQLVDAVSLEPLAEVDAAGVPEGEGWAFNQVRNDFELHPGAREDEQPDPRVRVRHLYVQTRADRELEIAASLVRDDLVTFYSVDEGDGGYHTIKPKPVKPLEFDKDSYKFESTRISGDEDSDYDLTTVDYYILNLSFNGEPMRFRTIEFEQRSGMVQWESRQFQEDVVSFTTYALHGDEELRIDAGLRDHLAKGEALPEVTIPPGRGCPEGSLLIGLHRTQYWYFDLMCEQTYARPLLVTVQDEYGNVHRLRINFASPTDRHTLVMDVI